MGYFKDFRNNVGRECYEDDTSVYSRLIFTASISILSVIFIIYIFDTISDLGINKKTLDYTAIVFGIVGVISLGLSLLCPYKVYKQTKINEKNK